MMRNTVLIVLLLLGSISHAQPHCVYLASDVYPGSYGSLPVNMVEFNGALYFRCTGSSAGPELWKYENGVSSLVADINPGAGGSMPNNFTVMGSDLYFTAFTAATGMELFKFDGTSVSLVADIYPGTFGSSLSYLTAIGSELYFTADDGVSGYEPWKYDGTTASLVADLNPGSASSNTDEYAGAGGYVYFTGIHPTLGFELWKYDGTTAVVEDLYPGSNGSDLGELTPVGSKICFRATNGTQGYELWVHDGTSATCLDVNTTGTGDFTPWEFTQFGSAVYFRGFNSATGYELWSYDGTTAVMIDDIFTGAGNAHPNHITAGTNVLYFAANDGTTGNELWKYDGTTTSFCGDIYPGATESIFGGGTDKFATVGDELYFVADDGVAGKELWRYDGNTVMLGRDIVPGTGSSAPSDMVGMGTSVFFMADDMVAGGELWEWNTTQDLTDSIAVETCDDYTSPGGSFYSGQGVYDFVDVLPSTNCPGCDSLLTIHLTISDPEDSLTVYTCDDYTSPAGNIYTNPGDYVFTDTIGSNLCPGVDSIIHIDLHILTNMNMNIFQTQGVAFVVQAGGNYQWLDCDNGYAAIPGEIDQDYIPTADGNYACEITIGSCLDTTACVYVEAQTGMGLGEMNEADISVYPNPASDLVTINSLKEIIDTVRIFNLQGSVVHIESGLNAQSIDIDVSSYESGNYYLELSTQDKRYLKKLVIE